MKENTVVHIQPSGFWMEASRPNATNHKQLGTIQSAYIMAWHEVCCKHQVPKATLGCEPTLSDTIQSKIWTYEYHIIQYNTVVPSTTGAVCWHRCGCVQIVAHRKGAMWKLLLSTSQHNHPLADLRYLCTALTENIRLWVKIVYGTFRAVPDVWNEGVS